MNPYRSMLHTAIERFERLDLREWFAYSEHVWQALLVSFFALLLIFVILASALFRYVTWGISIPQAEKNIAPSVTPSNVTAASERIKEKIAREAYLKEHHPRIVDPSR